MDKFIYCRHNVKWIITSIVVATVIVNIDGLFNKEKTPLSDLEQIRYNTIHRINRLWRKMSHQDWERIAKQRGGVDVRLLEEYSDICDALHDTTSTTIVPPLVVESLWSYAIVDVEATGIIGLYKNFRQHQKTPNSHPHRDRRKWQDFAENVVEDSVTVASVIKAMDRMDEVIQGTDNTTNIYVQLLKEAESNLCNVQQSLHQLIYNIYTALQMTQLKGYTMMQFSWMLLRLYGKGNFTMEAARGREKYISRMKTQIQKAKEALKNADQSYQRCDPERQIQDETYTSITKLLQGYLVNEVDLNSDGSCRGSCGDYSYTQQYGCFKNKFCSQQKKCNGRIVDCRFMDSDMSVCQADSDEVRYNWINYENGITLGHTDKSCSYRRQVDSWWRWVFWHCSYCMCICDDPFYSDRYINLRPAISNLSANKVVTALRFVKVDHIIHLQIQEGLLMPKAIINETSVEWRDVASYKAGSTGEKDKDYHMFSWEERAIDLDDVTVTKPNYVMTGVKFRKIGTHLNLEIQITPFNFTTGVLNDPHHKSEWISNDNTDKSYTPRTEVRLDRPDVPILFSGNKPNSKHDQFMMFTHTDVYKDVAQHTVPYIDTQIVGPSPPAPLVGAGIMHRGLSGSGGYIAPKVFTYSMVPHLQDDDFNEPPEKSKAKYEF